MASHRRLAITVALISPLIMGGLTDCDRGRTVIFQALCPNAKEYSLETQKKALAELRAVYHQIPTVRRMMGDYEALMRASAKCIEDQERAKKAASRKKAAS